MKLKKIFAEIHIKTILSGTSSSIKTKLWRNSHWMVLFQNCVRQSWSPTKMAATVQLRCYWKQLWSRWAITGSWEPLDSPKKINVLHQMSWTFFSGSLLLINEWLTSLFQSYNKMFKCPTIGFTCKQRKLYSFNRWVPFAVF